MWFVDRHISDVSASLTGCGENDTLALATSTGGPAGELPAHEFRTSADPGNGEIQRIFRAQAFDLLRALLALTSFPQRLDDLPADTPRFARTRTVHRRSSK